MRHPFIPLAAMALALSGCTGGSEDPSSPSPSASPSSEVTGASLPQAPSAGGCYRLTVEDAGSPTSDAEPVRCSSRHTSQTIHVGRLDLVVGGHRLAVDSARAQQQMARTCVVQLDRFLGGDVERRRLSRFQVVWFSPGLDDAAAGADWFRCDLVAFGAGDQLMELPRRGGVRGVLDRADALATYGLCGTARPGDRGFRRVACALPHSWVAVSTVTIPGERYPGAASLRASGDDVCLERVRSANDVPLEFSYGWEWPTAAQWDAGQRYGYCWAPNQLA